MTWYESDIALDTSGKTVRPASKFRSLASLTTDLSQVLWIVILQTNAQIHCVVNSTADAGPNTLRGCILATNVANPPAGEWHQVLLDSSLDGQKLSVATVLPAIARRTNISAASKELLFELDGDLLGTGGTGITFTYDSGHDARIANLYIHNFIGDGVEMGALRNEVHNCVISGNTRVRAVPPVCTSVFTVPLDHSPTGVSS